MKRKNDSEIDSKSKVFKKVDCENKAKSKDLKKINCEIASNSEVITEENVVTFKSLYDLISR